MGGVVMKLQRSGLSRSFSRAVVTGGAGFLGSHLCDALVNLNVEVICVDNYCTGSPKAVEHLRDHRLFSLVEYDISRGLPIEGPVDLVLHFASPASPPQYAALPLETLRVGSEGTLNALHLARTHGARFVMASTSEVYGDPNQHPQREDYWGNVNPIGPRSMYDEAKRFAEALTVSFGRTEGADVGILRIFNTYGPRMRLYDGRAVPNFIRQALTGKPLTLMGTGEQTRSLCYVDDLVRGVLAMASADHPGPINIGNPQEFSVRELALRILELTNSQSTLRFVAGAEDDPKRRCPDVSLAERELEWTPTVDISDGLRRTIEWTVSSLSGHLEKDHIPVDNSKL